MIPVPSFVLFGAPPSCNALQPAGLGRQVKFDAVHSCYRLKRVSGSTMSPAGQKVLAAARLAATGMKRPVCAFKCDVSEIPKDD
jgi:hypothetical protein